MEQRRRRNALVEQVRLLDTNFHAEKRVVRLGEFPGELIAFDVAVRPHVADHFVGGEG